MQKHHTVLMGIVTGILTGMAQFAGCGGQSTPAVEDTPHIDFSSLAYTLQPGEEKYYCYTTRLPADQAIALTRLVPTYGTGTHHILFSQTIASEPEGFSECPVLSKNTWLPLYAAGREAGPLAPPAGSAFKILAKGQQLVMQLHLQNASTQPITDKTSMRMEYIDASKPFVAAGLFGFDNRILDIPAHSPAALNTMTCNMDRSLDVFAVMGHMHKHGKHLQISRGARPGDEMLFDTDWNFDLQPITAKSFKVTPGDKIHIQCAHRNDADTAIKYGESSDTEMCAALFFYVPNGDVDGCVNE